MGFSIQFIIKQFGEGSSISKVFHDLSDLKGHKLLDLIKCHVNASLMSLMMGKILRKRSYLCVIV